MRRQVVTLTVVGNEGTHLDVFPNHLLCTDIVALLTEAVGHTVVGDFSGIGDIGEYGVGNVVIDGTHDCGCQLLTQSFALLIDVTIRPTTEVDTFKRTGAVFILTIEH